MTAPTPLPWHDQQAAYAADRAKVRAGSIEAYLGRGKALAAGVGAESGLSGLQRQEISLSVDVGGQGA